MLDFSALQPGRKATDSIHRVAADLKLAEKFGASVQLTGTAPMNDDQFSIIQQSAPRDTLIALFGTLIILWLAAVAFSVVVGLATAAALGLAFVGVMSAPICTRR